MTVIYTISGVLLLAAAGLTLLRALLGPTTMDRVVAVDMIVALAICGLAAYAAAARDSSLVPAVVALTLLGFVGSVSVARYRVKDDQQ